MSVDWGERDNGLQFGKSENLKAKGYHSDRSKGDEHAVFSIIFKSKGELQHREMTML